MLLHSSTPGRGLEPRGWVIAPWCQLPYPDRNEVEFGGIMP
jgi:hypothetical protein